MADKCPLGDDCDLTLAYMMGAQRAKDTIVVLRRENERLRADITRMSAEWTEYTRAGNKAHEELLADRIRLTAENERLRAALARIENEGDGTHAVDLARDALKENSNDHP